jgi:hypothetical protein
VSPKKELFLQDSEFDFVAKERALARKENKKGPEVRHE